MHDKISFSEILQVEGGVIFSSGDGEGLYFLENGKKEAVLLAVFPLSLSRRGVSYKALAKMGGKIVLPPCLAEDIAVYDCEAKSFQTIKLDQLSTKRKEQCKFWTSVVFGDYVYLIGHYYPAIVKINIHMMEMSFLTDWVEQIEQRRKLEDQPYLGIGIVQGNVAMFPCCCANIVLRLDLKTDEIEIHEIPADIGGFNGICFSEEKYWLTSRDSCAVVIWDRERDYAKMVKLEDERKYKEVVPFSPPLTFHGKLYLLPYWADHAYSIDTVDYKVQKLGALDDVLALRQDDGLNISKIVSPPKLVDGKIWFVTGKDKNWHIYDPVREDQINFSVGADKYAWRVIKQRKALKCIDKNIRERDIIPIFLEEKTFFCRDFCDLLCLHQDEIAASMTRRTVLKESIGQRIYNRFSV